MIDFEKLKNVRQKRNRFATKLGIRTEEIRLGYGRVSKVITEDDLNPMGLAHGGIYFTMADNAAGTAIASHGYLAVTLSANYNFLRSAGPGDTVIAEGREVKYGKTIGVCDVTVTDQNGTLLGTGTFTFYRLDKPIVLE